MVLAMASFAQRAQNLMIFNDIHISFSFSCLPAYTLFHHPGRLSNNKSNWNGLIWRVGGGGGGGRGDRTWEGATIHRIKQSDWSIAMQ